MGKAFLLNLIDLAYSH